MLFRDPKYILKYYHLNCLFWEWDMFCKNLSKMKDISLTTLKSYRSVTSSFAFQVSFLYHWESLIILTCVHLLWHIIEIKVIYLVIFLALTNAFLEWSSQQQYFSMRLYSVLSISTDLLEITFLQLFFPHSTTLYLSLGFCSEHKGQLRFYFFSDSNWYFLYLVPGQVKLWKR